MDFQRPFAAPADARELLLVRHGSTGSSAVATADRTLSEEGRAQARAVAERLAGERIAALVVSSLRRTAETAAPLVAAVGLEPVVVTDLREVELGDWERGGLARRAARRDPEFERVVREQRWDVIPNAEPAAAFAERVGRGLAAAIDAAGDRPGVVVVFTHAGVIAEACRQVTGSEPFAFLTATNGSVTRIVRLASGRWLLVGFNEVAHLR